MSIHAQFNTQLYYHISFLSKTIQLKYKQLYTVTCKKNNISAMDIPLELYSFQLVVPNANLNWGAQNGQIFIHLHIASFHVFCCLSKSLMKEIKSSLWHGGDWGGLVDPLWAWHRNFTLFQPNGQLTQMVRRYFKRENSLERVQWPGHFWFHSPSLQCFNHI